MSRGGKRDGAGRKKGAVSEETARRKEIAEAALNSGLTPLEFMLSVLRDETKDFKARYDAAVDAAPYVHPKLSSLKHEGDKDNPLALAILSNVPSADDDDQRPAASSH